MSKYAKVAPSKRYYIVVTSTDYAPVDLDGLNTQNFDVPKEVYQLVSLLEERVEFLESQLQEEA